VRLHGVSQVLRKSSGSADPDVILYIHPCPLLFILAIDPLQRIIDKAAQRGILNPVLRKAATLRCSLYADDAAIFAYPTNTELDNLLRLLHFFGIVQGSRSTSPRPKYFL